MKFKNRYQIDKENRLIIKRKRKTLVTNGRFSTGKDNQLIYWLNQPLAWRRLYSLPKKIVFQGNWRLNTNYNLELTLDKTNEQYAQDTLVLKGEIISTDRDTLAFEIKSLNQQGLSQVQLLNLTGFWQANEYNQLVFLIKKKTAPDILEFTNIWQINKHQQISYSYEKINLKTKHKSLHTLVLKGFWQINTANKLTYILSRSSKSRFDFRVQIESPNLYPKEGVIKYRLGIGLKQDKPSRMKTVTLYGTWKFSRKLGLIFQMDYGQGQIHNIEFGTDISLTQRDRISFALKNKSGEPLGINITFTHRFLKKYNADLFLRLNAARKEAGVETGLRIPF